MDLKVMSKLYLTPRATSKLLDEAIQIEMLIKKNRPLVTDSRVFTNVIFDKKNAVRSTTHGVFFPERNEFYIEQIYGSFYWESEKIKCEKEFIFEVLFLVAVKNIAPLDVEQCKKARLAEYFVIWKEKMEAQKTIA